MKRPLLLAALTVLSWTCPAAEPGGAFVPQSFAGDVTIKLGYSYLLTLPEGYESAPAKKWPLLVFLHGAGINVLKFDAIRDLPIWIFHGAKDTTVPVQFSEMAMNWLKRLKAPNAKLTVYPEAGHNAWTQTYDNPEVWTWLFAQRRK